MLCFIKTYSKQLLLLYYILGPRDCKLIEQQQEKEILKISLFMSSENIKRLWYYEMLSRDENKKYHCQLNTS